MLLPRPATANWANAATCNLCHEWLRHVRTCQDWLQTHPTQRTTTKIPIQILFEQTSYCSSTAGFCKFIEWVPSIISKYVFSYLVTIFVPQVMTGTTNCFVSHIRWIYVLILLGAFHKIAKSDDYEGRLISNAHSEIFCRRSKVAMRAQCVLVATTLLHSGVNFHSFSTPILKQCV